MTVVVRVWGLTERDRGEAEAEGRAYAEGRGHEVAAIDQSPHALASARDHEALEQRVVFGRTWAVYPAISGGVS